MKHIKVVLDFIPVEERLPEHTSCVWAVIDGTTYRAFYDLHDRSTAKRVWQLENGVIFAPNEVTHWAEIPEIE